jgi:hypothetical protein
MFLTYFIYFIIFHFLLTNRQTDGWMDGNGRTNKRMDGQTDGTNEQTDGWTEWTNKQTDGRTDGTDKQTDGWTEDEQAYG